MNPKIEKLAKDIVITVCTFMPPFFLPDFGCRPTPLSMLSKSVIVVESIMSRSWRTKALRLWIRHY